MIGHCMRGLALLGKGKEAENVFARVAIMYVASFVPLVRPFLAITFLSLSHFTFLPHV